MMTKKAFYRVWTYNILRTMHSWGLRGSIISLVEDFMSDRFRVGIVNYVSQLLNLENKVTRTQCFVVNVTLFLVAIYINTIYTASRSMLKVQCRMQLAINNVSARLIKNGLA